MTDKRACADVADFYFNVEISNIKSTIDGWLETRLAQITLICLKVA